MFGIDFPELMVIGVVALVVLGPERLPKAARFVGLWVRRARGQWNSVKSELERELAADEFRRTLHDTEKAMRDIDADVRAADADARREFDAMRKATTASANAAGADVAAPLAGQSPPADGEIPAPPAHGAAEPFDTLADFDPYAVEPQTAAPDAAVLPDAVTGSAAAPSAAAASPSSAFASAAAALARHQADAELSAAAVMTGPKPPPASLPHDSIDRDLLDVDSVALPAAAATPRASASIEAPAARDDHDARSA